MHTPVHVYLLSDSTAYSPQVHAVLQSAIDKLSLLAAIIVDPQVQARELTQSVGDEISRMIDEQKRLEQRFQELIAAQPALRALPNKANLQGNQLELQEVSEALRQATKQLCRNLKDNPNVAENMAKVAAQREVLQQLLSSTLDSLDEFGTVQPIIEARLAAEQAEVGYQCVCMCQLTHVLAFFSPACFEFGHQLSVTSSTQQR